MNQAVCLFVQRADGMILAVSRKDSTTEFGLPGGKVDPGETPEQALVREVREETGLHVDDFQPVFTKMCHGKVDYESITFTANVLDGEIHTDEPHIVAWVTPDVLLRGPFGPYNRALFETLGISS